ncbi:hypothetical protein [Azospirillum canadense]|uniref:hypothetical protein n=1 Tax=Azospirillum canadense TaxID=403962 RepID=UPI002226FD4A|nr:hypothetical protein [Azospirillum canadense]MCW2242760.1 hypothetical protein [Azospirillum canadense]
MAKNSRSHQRRRERRATISRKEGGLTALQALVMADDLDLPDGAAYAFAMEMSGLDHDSFFDDLAAGAR